jgi:hypothetical protein
MSALSAVRSRDLLQRVCCGASHSRAAHLWHERDREQPQYPARHAPRHAAGGGPFDAPASRECLPRRAAWPSRARPRLNPTRRRARRSGVRDGTEPALPARSAFGTGRDRGNWCGGPSGPLAARAEYRAPGTPRVHPCRFGNLRRRERLSDHRSQGRRRCDRSRPTRCPESASTQPVLPRADPSTLAPASSARSRDPECDGLSRTRCSSMSCQNTTRATGSHEVPCGLPALPRRDARALGRGVGVAPLA